MLLKAMLLLGAGWPALLPAVGQVVFGYYPDWVGGGTHAMGPEAIDYEKMTHIAVAFAYPDSQGNLQAHVPQYYSLLPVLTDSARPHGVKVLVSLGGATLSYGFVPTCAQPDTLDKFVGQLVAQVDYYGLDGVDFDWEFPADSTEGEYYTNLVRTVREQLDLLDSTLLTTLAGAFWGDWGGKYINTRDLEPYLDLYNVMTYNYAGTWSAVSGHNAPLFGTGHCINRSVGFFLDAGVSRNKLTIGIPFYGKTFGSCMGLNEVFTGAGTLGPSPAYYEIAPLVNAAGYTRVWDGQAMCPYLVGNDQVISYDDSLSVHYKTRYAVDSSLAGVMIWQLEKGFMADGTWKGQQPLLEAIYTACCRSGLSLAATIPNAVPQALVLTLGPNRRRVILPYPGGRLTDAFLYDLAGRQVAACRNSSNPETGNVLLEILPQDRLASGVYTLWGRVENRTITARITLVK